MIDAYRPTPDELQDYLDGKSDSLRPRLDEDPVLREEVREHRLLHTLLTCRETADPGPHVDESDLAAYHDEALGSDDMKRVSMHLQGCKDCLAAFLGLKQLMQEDLRETPPGHVTARVLKTLGLGEIGIEGEVRKLGKILIQHIHGVLEVVFSPPMPEPERAFFSRIPAPEPWEAIEAPPAMGGMEGTLARSAKERRHRLDRDAAQLRLQEELKETRQVLEGERHRFAALVHQMQEQFNQLVAAHDRLLREALDRIMERSEALKEGMARTTEELAFRMETLHKEIAATEQAVDLARREEPTTEITAADLLLKFRVSTEGNLVSLEVRAFDRESGTPVAGVPMTLIPTTDKQVGTTTDPQGITRFLLPPEAATLQIERGGVWELAISLERTPTL